MGKRSFIEQLCHSLGKNNDASYAVVAVATAKGIFRPMFTMMDKEQDYETKKYTALREGLTEAIAIPCYLSVAWAAKNLIAPMICKEGNEQVAKAAKTLSFLGVCTAALIIIPATCSAMITPIMGFLSNHNIIKGKPAKNSLDVTSPAPAAQLVTPAPQVYSYNKVPAQTIKPLPNAYSAFSRMSYNPSLKVGGNQ